MTMVSEYRLVVFSIAGHKCALPLESVVEALHLPATAKVPGQPSIVLGFLHLRGRVLAVVDLRRMFEPNCPEPGLHATVVVVRTGESEMGLLVDAIDGLTIVPATRVQPLARDHSFNNCALFQFHHDGDSTTVLSPDRVLLEKERQCVNDLAEQLRKRLEESA